MLLFVVCFSVITQATDLNYNELVSNVKDTLDQCSTIVDDVGNYVEEVHELDVLRRRATTDAKLGACKEILEAVDEYRVEHNRQLLIQSFTEWPGNAILNVLLRPVNKRMGKVLYRASTNGDDISRFHRECDNKGPTIIIVQSTTGAVFGGYTDVSWASSGGFKRSSTSFLFRIHPSVEKYDIISGKEHMAVMHRATDLMFGAGGQLVIYSGSLHNSKSFVNGVWSYNTPSGDPYVLNNGQKHFKVLDYFVVEAKNL